LQNRAKRGSNCQSQDDDNSWYSDYSVQGYFRSPYEDRLAILMFYITNGYGEPWEEPFFIGSHLDYGFEK